MVAVVDYYFPSAGGGGVPHGVRAVMSDPGVDGVIVTTDHDFGDRTPHPLEIRLADDGGTPIDYVPSATWRWWTRVLRYEPDAVVLTSPFSRRTIRILIGRALARLRPAPRRAPVVVIWSQGEMGAQALSEKPLRKRTFLVGGRLLGLFRGVSWFVASPTEIAGVERFAGSTPDYFPYGLPDVPPVVSREPKRPGCLDLVYVGRLVERKGVHLVLEALARVEGAVRFTIVGPEADEEYVARCRALAAALPAPIEVVFAGPVDGRRAAEVFAGHDASVLLTQYESFGYAIYESLARGCVAVVSHATPFDFGGDDGGLNVDRTVEAARRAVQRLVDEDGESFRRRSSAARSFAVRMREADDHASTLVARLAELAF